MTNSTEIIAIGAEVKVELLPVELNIRSDRVSENRLAAKDLIRVDQAIQQ